MPDQLSKLRPDRDLQCYFHRPSAVAALSGASATGFTVSGSWREQFDWAVLEWNRDNVFEYPALRNLPDGDLSGIVLSYQETRNNCIPLDSTLYPTVEWPFLRIWAESNGTEQLYDVPLKGYATPVGNYTEATATLELQGLATAGDYVELAWLDQHYNYMITPGDTLATAIGHLTTAITANQNSGMVSASATGAQIVLTYHGSPGSNGNRIGVYGTVHGAGTESWTPSAALFSGGLSPQQWLLNLDFSGLKDVNGNHVPTSAVRKMRWTWAADLQAGRFQRSDFAAVVTSWTVSGGNLLYSVAGPGTRRMEDAGPEIQYNGNWVEGQGNFSGGTIHWTSTPGDSLLCNYKANAGHTLYLGSRLAGTCGAIAVQIDGGLPVTYNLQLSGEDVLVRLAVTQGAGLVPHSVTIRHTGPAGSFVYFDFLEIAYPSTSLPAYSDMEEIAIATDWDTDHSIAIAAERTAWLIDKLGFHGRVNHYAGAMWFYELVLQQNAFATGTITFAGSPEFGKTTQVALGPTIIQHLNLIGDSEESVAKCFELLINSGSTGVFAAAAGSVLTITSRTLGSACNSLTLGVTSTSSGFTGTLNQATLSGGIDGIWRTDLSASPRINRAARDWSSAFFAALAGASIGVTTSFSMELQNGDDSTDTDLAQRYPNGDPVWLNTPALQTNFGPASTTFWKEVYLEMAGLMARPGIKPYLQFGEVQWWYFADTSGMPFYDSYTKASFLAQHGRPMATIVSQNADPNTYPDEAVFLPRLIGAFTSAIMAYVRQTYSNSQFEVLYPPDVNDTPLNRLINYPHSDWTASSLNSLKTENFTYTGDHDLNKALNSILLPIQLGFGRSQCSHLIGISDPNSPWVKEQLLAAGQQLESVVLFALDQFCLIGYHLPVRHLARRSRYMAR